MPPAPQTSETPIAPNAITHPRVGIESVTSFMEFF